MIQMQTQLEVIKGYPGSGGLLLEEHHPGSACERSRATRLSSQRNSSRDYVVKLIAGKIQEGQKISFVCTHEYRIND